MYHQSFELIKADGFSANLGRTELTMQRIGTALKIPRGFAEPNR